MSRKSPSLLFFITWLLNHWLSGQTHQVWESEFNENDTVPCNRVGTADVEWHSRSSARWRATTGSAVAPSRCGRVFLAKSPSRYVSLSSAQRDRRFLTKRMTEEWSYVHRPAECAGRGSSRRAGSLWRRCGRRRGCDGTRLWRRWSAPRRRGAARGSRRAAQKKQTNNDDFLDEGQFIGLFLFFYRIRSSSKVRRPLTGSKIISK